MTEPQPKVSLRGAQPVFSPGFAALLARDEAGFRAASAEREQREAEENAVLEADRARRRAEREAQAARRAAEQSAPTVAEQVEAGVRAALGLSDRPMTAAELAADLRAKSRQLLAADVDANGNPVE